MSQVENTLGDLLGEQTKTSYFHVFGYRAYMFLSIKIHANKLTPHSELMIFIGYENNRYCFMYYIQENIIFCFTHAIFDKGFFSKCTDSYVKECKLYDNLLNKISSEIESLVSDPSRKDRPALVLILHTSIPPIQNNPPTCFSSPSLFYKLTSPPPTPRFKKPIVEIEENDDVDFDVEMQPPSPQ